MKQQKLMELRNKMQEQAPKDVPVFKVFVRPKAGGPWIPCGDLAGDNRAKAVVEAMMAGFLKDMYKGNLDTGVARSIFSQEEAFVKNLIENFKPFRKYTPDMLEFGYKVEYPGLVEKLGEQTIQLLEKEMQVRKQTHTIHNFILRIGIHISSLSSHRYDTTLPPPPPTHSSSTFLLTHNSLPENVG